MTVLLRFGALLAHLAGRRALDSATLAAAAGTDPVELQALLGGQPPGGRLLNDLGPVLGLHAADLFVLAGQSVPDDLTPITRNPNWSIDTVVYNTMVMPADNRRPLLEAIRAQPCSAVRLSRASSATPLQSVLPICAGCRPAARHHDRRPVPRVVPSAGVDHWRARRGPIACTESGSDRSDRGLWWRGRSGVPAAVAIRARVVEALNS
ncbi:hypothetical protein PUR71_10020 [Streptomyces sp. SP17BM10]|uniref:hypothetical protein n=1 Tax=Streptomyces sp. SP17BM10 TaxID=3002530 RepID=UPI002E77634B|nr:hypothetical protein [Streptomyces sp. SP17BM10]MEE1783247.1 hypothetical protein [Streptomyces sp. SP17BM10]